MGRGHEANSHTEIVMNRILSAVVLGAALLAAGTTAFASHHHATRVHTAGVTKLAANAACPDPAHCPVNACRVGSRASAAAAPTLKPGAVMSAAVAPAHSGSCSNPASCPKSCPRDNASAMAAGVAKH
jgi:hypothetical protein